MTTSKRYVATNHFMTICYAVGSSQKAAIRGALRDDCNLSDMRIVTVSSSDLEKRTDDYIKSHPSYHVTATKADIALYMARDIVAEKAKRKWELKTRKSDKSWAKHLKTDPLANPFTLFPDLS